MIHFVLGILSAKAEEDAALGQAVVEGDGSQKDDERGRAGGEAIRETELTRWVGIQNRYQLLPAGLHWTAPTPRSVPG